jgi:hypothetical protein
LHGRREVANPTTDSRCRKRSHDRPQSTASDLGNSSPRRSGNSREITSDQNVVAGQDDDREDGVVGPAPGIKGRVHRTIGV